MRGRVPASVRSRGGVYASAMPHPVDAGPAVHPQGGSEGTPRVATFALGGFQTNCHVVWVPDAPDPGARRKCWIVDCGEGPRPLLEFVRRERLVPEAILFTHAHADHIAGVDEAIRVLGPDVPRLVHPAEAAAFQDPQFNLSAFVGQPISVAAPTGALEPGRPLTLAGTRWEVLHTPGHSPGGVTLHHPASGLAIVGDTLFAGSIGRVDFPTSDPARMRDTLFRVLLRLPDATRVLPGHGPETTIGEERLTNPYLRPEAWEEW